MQYQNLFSFAGRYQGEEVFLARQGLNQDLDQDMDQAAMSLPAAQDLIHLVMGMLILMMTRNHPPSSTSIILSKKHLRIVL